MLQASSLEFCSINPFPDILSNTYNSEKPDFVCLICSCEFSFYFLTEKTMMATFYKIGFTSKSMQPYRKSSIDKNRTRKLPRRTTQTNAKNLIVEVL